MSGDCKANTYVRKLGVRGGKLNWNVNGGNQIKHEKNIQSVAFEFDNSWTPKSLLLLFYFYIEKGMKQRKRLDLICDQSY